MSLRTIYKQRICYVGFGVNKSVFTGSLLLRLLLLNWGFPSFHEWERNADRQCGRIREAGSMPGLGRPPGESMVTHPGFSPGEHQQMEKSGGLQSIGRQRARHKWSNLAHTLALTTRTLLKRPWDLSMNCKGIHSSTLVFPGFVIGIYVLKSYTYCTSLTNT